MKFVLASFLNFRVWSQIKNLKCRSLMLGEICVRLLHFYILIQSVNCQLKICVFFWKISERINWFNCLYIKPDTGVDIWPRRIIVQMQQCQWLRKIFQISRKKFLTQNVAFKIYALLTQNCTFLAEKKIRMYENNTTMKTSKSQMFNCHSPQAGGTTHW